MKHTMVLAILALALPAAAQQPTDANLITAIDVSGSIKPYDERLEFEGMARAVVDPIFLQTIARGHYGRIGFIAFTWANGEFVPLVPWSLIGSEADAARVAQLIRAARGPLTMGYATRLPAMVRPWRTGYATDVSAAIERALEVSAGAPFASDRHVINICANGVDNVGEGPTAWRDRADARGVLINGLILGHRDDAEEIAAWYRAYVQTGPGSFVIVARAFEDIASAMLAKFVFEIAGATPPGARSRAVDTVMIAQRGRSAVSPAASPAVRPGRSTTPETSPATARTARG